MITDLMSQELRVPKGYILNTINSADRRYKEFEIPKRDGSLRLIQHPSRRLKILQRWVARRIFDRLPVHSAATAYRKGSCILVNADRHVGQRYLLKVDFKDFFPSVRDVDVEGILRSFHQRFERVYEVDDVPAIVKIVCRRGSLVIGAPSSPVVSNAMLYAFDKLVAEFCESAGVNYTRYADDLTFSCSEENRLSEVLKRVRQVTDGMSSPKLTINEKKIHHSSRKRRMRVTGLVLSIDNKVSIGRKNKRYIRSLVHRFLSGDLPIGQQQYLLGYLNFVNGVEPNLLSALEQKYHFRFMRGQIVPIREPLTVAAAVASVVRYTDEESSD